jgi:hypothetical protein
VSIAYINKRSRNTVVYLDIHSSLHIPCSFSNWIGIFINDEELINFVSIHRALNIQIETNGEEEEPSKTERTE